MFIAERTTYTGPVTSPEQLAAGCPEYFGAYRQFGPATHMLTIKTCNAPDLLKRCIGSMSHTPAYLQHIIIDDSPHGAYREANCQIAQEFGAQYYSTKGELSLIGRFSDYLAGSEGSGGQHLREYLHRITTDYPKEPAPEAWGGVAGAQNLGHLANVMNFGEQNLPPSEWLSTFIDDDIVMPLEAASIFKLTAMYSHLGNVSVIASNYLHHSGNPIALTRDVLQDFVAFSHEMSEEQVEEEMRNMLLRVPNIGLRNAERSDEDYTHPELTMTFPGGNYSLSGHQAFQIPVPVVGIEDMGYGSLLQTFIGARELGVARVPDFPHIRYRRPDGGDAHDGNSNLLAFFGATSKGQVHARFHELVMEYASSARNISGAALEGSTLRERVSKQKLLGQLKAVAVAAKTLLANPRFTAYEDTLCSLKQGARYYAQEALRPADEDDLDTRAMTRLIDEMRDLHPVLIQKAYEFGAEGRLR